jgi:hypothetical protein
MPRIGLPRKYSRQCQENVDALEGGRALDVVAHEVPTTVADELLAGPLEPCRREVVEEPHDPEAANGGGTAQV